MRQMMNGVWDHFGKKIKILFLVIYDIFAVGVAEHVALWTRFEFSYNEELAEYLRVANQYLIINLAMTLFVFYLFKLYHSLWKYASVQELVNVVLACFLSSVMQMIGTFMLQWNLPRSYYILYFFFLLVLVVTSRFLYRAVRILKNSVWNVGKSDGINTMVVGAGDTASSLIKDMNSNAGLHNRIRCVIDADPQKIGNNILGIPIVGNDDKILWAVEKYGIQEIFIAIPNLTLGRKRRILDICKNSGCKLRILPSVKQLVDEEVRISNFRDVEIEDLLGREEVQTNLDEVAGYISDKVVLVTGGGGSIGSELCRQIAQHNPKKLVILDIYENTTYDLQQELMRDYPNLDLKVLIGSVRNTKRMDDIMALYQPEIVYHAAAHKHVPLMEESPNEAVKNNVLGTWKVVQAADKAKVKKFVMISTDKAVNPTNIMGATKRICEMIIQTYNNRSQTEFVAVRFGNVLGSNGSVIPLFKKQIESGGPVTVTHPDIIRYFMTIPEAVSLVLQAGAFAKGGEIFVLDMGEPVKILDLAKNLILFSGHKPDEDIKIEFTGLRPGEKLFEEMLMDEEGLQDTANHMIHIGKPIDFDEEKFLKNLEELRDYVVQEPEDIRQWVQRIVPNYSIRKN